jgi:hypothetical protein
MPEVLEVVQQYLLARKLVGLATLHQQAHHKEIKVVILLVDITLALEAAALVLLEQIKQFLRGLLVGMAQRLLFLAHP